MISLRVIICRLEVPIRKHLYGYFLKLLTGIWVRGYLQEQRLEDRCVMKAHPSMGGSSQKLRTWSPLHSLQTAQQAGECPLQVPQVV